MNKIDSKQNNILEVNLKTLTPFWTGGYDGNSETLRDTSLIGSLRWWYRQLLDLSESKDTQNEDELFGTTENSRAFRLVSTDAENIDLYFKSNKTVYQSNSHWLYSIFGAEKHNGSKEKKGIISYYDFGELKAIFNCKSEIKIKLIALKNYETTLANLAFLMDFVTNYGALGAKTQYGFGYGKWINPDLQRIKEGYTQFILDKNELLFNKRFISLSFSIQNSAMDKYNKELMIIGRKENESIKAYDRKFVPTAYDIRYSFRKGEKEINGISGAIKYKLKNDITKKDLSMLIGDKNKIKSRINVSSVYYDDDQAKWFLKIWAFLPPTLDISKEELVRVIIDQVNVMFDNQCEVNENAINVGGDV
ncbi:MAG TPA: type III-B CRISPR module RAMP protein Cmr1 [Caldisericia bacterium]|nr:type III-B CRISPR module RAMP protein Cmr1 [Caldisericia bacterium]